MGEASIDPRVRIGHVHLKVAYLQRGGYHHHIGLNTWESRDRSPPPQGTTGLYHFAILYPTRVTLAEALRRLM